MKGQSSIRSSLFNGSKYAYSKTQMKTFLTYCGFDLWQVILDGHVDPTLERCNWDEKSKKDHALNVKAMNALICAPSETVRHL